jgi:hypothetical protein
MRRYLITVFNKIVISRILFVSNGEYHKGEFNPGMKIIVFHWADFEGYRYENDNLNLASFLTPTFMV